MSAPLFIVLFSSMIGTQDIFEKVGEADIYVEEIGFYDTQQKTAKLLVETEKQDETVKNMTTAKMRDISTARNVKQEFETIEAICDEGNQNKRKRRGVDAKKKRGLKWHVQNLGKRIRTLRNHLPMTLKMKKMMETMMGCVFG